MHGAYVECLPVIVLPRGQLSPARILLAHVFRYDAIIVEPKPNAVSVIFKGETEAVDVDIDFVRLKLASVER